MYMLPRPLG